MRIRTLALSCVLMTAPIVAAAQAPPTPATPPARTAPPAPSRAAVNCGPQQPSHPGVVVPEGTTTGQALGDKLAKSDGVLCPPAGVDPEMQAPTPQGGNTPVIPPPGSRGGDPSVRPK
nr:hypothetical protein [Bradyrhizobium sp. th.b2]